MHDTQTYILVNKTNAVVVMKCCLLKSTVIHYPAFEDSMSKAEGSLKYIVILFA